MYWSFTGAADTPGVVFSIKFSNTDPWTILDSEGTEVAERPFNDET
jgi:hypothetical protein